MKYKIVTLVILIFLTTCKKDKLHVDYVPGDTEVKYKIILSQDTIKEISTYNNNQLISTKQYFFNDSTVEIISKNANGIVTENSLCFFGSSGYVELSIDSSYSDSGTFASISISYFEYQNEFLTKKTVDTGKYVYTYSINDANIISSNIAYQDYQTGCTDYYTYSSYSTTIDVRNFNNKIFGKPSKNIISEASWRTGCPCGASTTSASSYFEYVFNNSGYVTMMKEYYTPCHQDASTNLTGTINTTTYEY